MKDVEAAAAPMISVPAGVLKEFMSPSNSRTPTPPLTTGSSTTSSSSTTTTTVTEAAAFSPSPSPSPVPSLAASITAALQSTTDNAVTANTDSNGSSEVCAKSRAPTPTPTSRTASPVLPVPKEKTSVTITSATSVGQVNGKVDEEDKEDIKVDVKTDNNDSNSMVNGLATASASQELLLSTSCNSASSASSSPSVLTTGVKRPNEDEENGKPDLKKIRVFPSVSKDGCKRELKITVKEVYDSLDLESKKFQEIKNSNNQNLVTLSRIKNGIAMLSGERGPSTDSCSQSPSATPSPVVTSGPEGEDAATPGLPEQATAPNKEQGLANKENVRAIRDKDRRLNKNGLKDAILRVFSENTLYGSELGHLKQMCEKLTSTLEVNMRKVAQFHKEIEDLRKVTTRLAAEHQARKGQYVAPIRIKRSVGIQAAPHIINKGIMHASVSGGNIKTIAPRTSNMVGVLPSSMSQNLIPGSTVGIITTSSGMRPATLTGIPAPAPGIPGATPASLGTTAVRAPNGQIMMMAPAATMQPLTRPAGGVNATTTVVPVGGGRVVRAPISNIGAVGPQAGTLIGTQRPILIQNDKGASSAPTIQTALPTGRAGGVIDLTDEDEGAKGVVSRNSMVAKPGTLKGPATATAQILPLQTGGVGQLGQVVLLPNTSGGQPTTALIVSQVSTGQTQDSISNPAVAQARITTYVNHTSSATRVQGTTPPAPARTSVTTPSPTTTIQQSNTVLMTHQRHPSRRRNPPCLHWHSADNTPPRMASKQRRQAYTVRYKLEVIEYAKQHGNRAAERHFGPPPTEKMIREWRKQEEELKKSRKGKHGLRNKEAKFPQLEEIIKSWVDDQRNKGYSVSMKMIMVEAKRLAAERNIPANEFTGSSSWCYRFMKRNNLSMRVKTRIAQKLPAEYEDKVLEFQICDQC